MELKKTDRGFVIAPFEDFNGVKCSVQKSSIATEDCIWLGADDIGLKKFKAYEGWSDVPLLFSHEEHFVANNRMHLSQDQVKALLPILTLFADTGELHPTPDPEQVRGK